MSAPQSFDVGIAHQIGRYSDAVRIPAGYDQIIVSGTPGLAEDGTVPAEFADEAAQAWRNVETILARAGAGLADVVSIRQWLTDAAYIRDYVAVRSRFIQHEPTNMLAVIPALVWPNLRVEVEVVAAIVQKGQ
ncbi:MAG TPA: Rid family hydrolase [Pseudonocardiaceae bacterium]|jgi:enamine deaminase RidA (YjgF/YER057c/UK114 family)